MRLAGRAPGHPREDEDPVAERDADSRLHGNDREGYRSGVKRHDEAPGGIGVILLKGALIGFTLGFVLAVLAGSWVWLEMRVNVGLLIPAATFLCAVSALWKWKAFPYALFLAGQVILIITLVVLYGFAADAFCAVPAYLFREGFHGSGLTLATARALVGGIFLGGNLLWIAFGRKRIFPTGDHK